MFFIDRVASVKYISLVNSVNILDTTVLADSGEVVIVLFCQTSVFTLI